MALWLCSFALAATAAEPAAPAAPDRRELWVPFDKLGHVLDANAVLLTREQYETLLRDAEREKGSKSEAPFGAVISSAQFRAVPDGKTAVIHAELRVNVLRDGWCEVPLDFPGAAIGEVKFDGEAAIGEVKPGGEGVLTPRNPALRAEAPPQAASPQGGKQMAAPDRPAMLLVRGRGEHRITFEITATIHSAGGVNTFALGVPTVAAGAFTLALPAGTTMEKSGDAVRVTKTADATTATVALSPSRHAIAFAWKAGAGNDSEIAVRAQAIVSFDIDAEKIAGSYRIHLEAALGELPVSFTFAVPAGVKVLAVRAEELRGWEIANGQIVANFQDGARKELDLEISVELQPVIGKNAVTTVLPLPVLQGASRLDGELHISGADNVSIKDITADARMRRLPTQTDRGERGFFGAYEFSGSGIAPRVVIERAVPGLESDLDTLVEFRSDAIFITRTITLREQKGRRFSTAITLPASEELLSVERETKEAYRDLPVPMAPKPPLPGQPPNPPEIRELPPRIVTKMIEPDWHAQKNAVTISWTDESREPRVFRLRSRIEPEKWTQLPAEGISLALGDAKIADSAKVTGYIALTADPAFRIEAQPGETLERRDGRSTPVRGEYAWFRRDAFDLTIKIARRPAEVLAALTGYVLPLEGLLDVHAVMNYQFMGGGTRAVKLRVPKDLAQNFHFDGPQIAERTLADDVWTVTFQKELTGAYALGITAQVPVVKQAGENGSKGYSFAVKVPVISPLDVVRASGLWAVEANTETEITFDAVGMNELDSLLAPQLADYAPRHRVIGVFGWLGANYALALNGVRHAPAAMLAAVVDALELNTVISTSGLHRHEAIYRLRVSGVEYFDVALPKGAVLLSTVIDGTAVKPVADRPGSVRLPLPAKRDANTGVTASLVYETGGDAWKNRGKLALAAPSIAAGIPVLKSTWRVWVPEGFSFSDIESNLPVPEAPPEELLVRAIGRVSLEKAASILTGVPAFASAQRSAWGRAVSTGRMMVSGQLRSGAGGPANSEEVANFFGTQMELMRSQTVLNGAKTRVRSMRPDWAEEEVKLEIRQLPKAGIFELKATGTTAAYTQAFLDAVMDEYIATKKAMRGQRQEASVFPVQDELVRLEKDMQKEEEEMHVFQKSNNIGFLKEDANEAVSQLAKMNRQLANLKVELDVKALNQSQRDSQHVQIKNLERAVGESEKKAADLARKVSEWDKIRSKIERTKAQYDRINAQLRGMDVVRNLDQDTVTILEHATVPKGGAVAVPKAPPTAAALPRAETPPRESGRRLSANDRITQKLNAIVFPKIDFSDIPVRDAINYLITEGRNLDPEKQGVNILMRLGEDGAGSATRITLTLKNVTMIEVLKYITNLANLKYKIEPSGIVIVPLGATTEDLRIKQWQVPPHLFGALIRKALLDATVPAGKSNAQFYLETQGVVFPPGAFAQFKKEDATLIAKNTGDQIDVIDTILGMGGVAPGADAGSALGGPGFGKNAGLLPVMLDLPKSGPALVFDGLYAPERVVMRYDDWWSRARALWMWFVSGGIAFYLIGALRPWWRTLWAVLVLSALPLCGDMAWMPVCNAVLGGWFAGLVLNRIGVWCVFRVRKEVLA